MMQKTLLEAYGLESWWNTMFTESEKQRIREVYAEHTDGDVIDKDPLVLTIGDSQLDPEDVDVTRILQLLTQWFHRNSDKGIWIKLSESWHHFADPCTTPVDRHFALSDTMKAYYRRRDEPEFLAKTIATCKVMISLEKTVAGAMFDAGLGRFLPENAHLFEGRVVHTELGPQVLPGHPGFKQLAIIYEKQKEFQAALDLCVEARDAGWDGDWDKRIVRLEKKLSK
ncbi:hypothetical protein HMPREF3056_11970 [Corynebacterium sp. HMSC056F09]|uniref:hypothetical protein n=1 Tax=Corynebacterium sp. HMSC056F09 TaxID=1739548 RepID=UPI0008A39045|nr:hypothetical protein [Corynebacterium sp. HMSC056F09]OFO17944.1 hypothetical protein HMPREF3056_11970 [Corynebacterium sp. HMSC056F09]